MKAARHIWGTVLERYVHQTTKVPTEYIAPGHRAKCLQTTKVPTHTIDIREQTLFTYTDQIDAGMKKTVTVILSEGF